MDAIYNHLDVEKKWYSAWVGKQLFSPVLTSDKPSFSIVMPPPNITGELHMGHALNVTLQDIIARYKRMKKFNVLFLPGLDHAGIATQYIVEKEIAKENLSRQELGKEEFVNRVWQWKEKASEKIISQLKSLGTSCDWTRLRFTMDEKLTYAVQEEFIRLYNEGLIYRDNYMINWCPRCRTALSDLEVEYKEVKGNFYYIKYPFKNGNGYITIATTRPETMLGDTAVAVHPSDERYKKFINEIVILPIMNREIPIIAEEKVDSSLGTGAVKITPSHDPIDFEIGKKHSLPFICVIAPDGRMNKLAGKYEGMDRYKCREEIVKELSKDNLIEKIEECIHSVGHCYRCGTAIEPYISLQWFVKMKPFAEVAKKAVQEKLIEFIPPTWNSIYFSWLDNIRDWCISRQIWWGHKIPIFYCKDCNEIYPTRTKPEICTKCGSTNFYEDPDVLDTWFSSALWPFSTLGWPEETQELKLFYPTSVLVTGFDIIFFWVARMIMMGIKFTGKVPFHKVYIHALVRDATGKKMSKSKGNIIDPMEMIEKYGADSLRFTLTSLCVEGRDIYLSEERIKGYRNFMNKIWNAARFVLANIKDFYSLNIKLEKLKFNLSQLWILSRMNKTIQKVTYCLENYKFSEAAQFIYNFFWKEFCDWYIEFSKIDIKNNKEATQYTFYTVLRNSLLLMHPIIPFITEEIWNKLPDTSPFIATFSWPEINKGEINDDVENKMQEIIEIIHSIRSVKAEMNVPLEKVDVIIKTNNDEVIEIIKENEEYIHKLAKVENISIQKEIIRPKDSAFIPTRNTEIYVLLEGKVDIEKERKRLEKELQEIEKLIAEIDAKLSSHAFLEKAPAHIIANEKEKKDKFIQKKEKILENIQRISF